jgi:hypothetical protein
VTGRLTVRLYTPVAASRVKVPAVTATAGEVSVSVGGVALVSDDVAVTYVTHTR